MPKLEQIGIDVIIFDSSDDAKTEAIVKNFQIDGHQNLIYKRWEGEFDGFSLDNKVIDAYKLYANKYEYLWVIRDGLIIQPNNIEKEIICHINDAKDIIILNTPWRDIKKIGNKEYHSSEELFSDQCMQMTILGASIIKSTLIIDIIDKIPLKKHKNYGMWQPIAFFEYLSDKSVKAVSVVADVFTYNPGAPNSSFLKKNTIKQWVELWSEMILNLPDCYSKSKMSVLKVGMSDFHPFYVSSLISLRANGGLYFSDVRRLKDKILLVSDTSVIKFYLISLIPVSFARYISKNDNGLVKGLKGLYYLVSGIVPGEKEILE